MNHQFIYISTVEGPVLINLSQIVKVTMPKGQEQEIVLHMSNGKVDTFHGEELVNRLVILFQQYSCDIYGKLLPIANLDDEIARGLAKRKAEETSGSNASPEPNR